MKLRIAFVTWPDDPSVMPNAMNITDEYMEDEHRGIPNFYEEEMKRLHDEHGAENVREMFVEIPDDAVVRLFTAPVVQAETTEPAS